MGGRGLRARTLIGLLALASATGVAGVDVSHASPSVARSHWGSMATFPQGIAPLQGSGLLSTGRFVYYEMLDPDGNTTIGRIGPGGTARTVGTTGSGYGYAPPTRTTDGAVWFAVDAGGEGGALGDTPNLSLAGLDSGATSLTIEPTDGFTLDGWVSVADRDGRFWAQGNTPGVGIIAVGAGLGQPPVSVQTNIGPVSSESDITINNPMILGPDSRVWMLGGDSFSGNLRVTSGGPDGIGADVAPAGLEIGALALTATRGKVWTVAADSSAALSAFGVRPSGATTTVPTPLLAECEVDAVQPVAGRHARLWFTGSNASCSRTSRLLVAEVRLTRDRVVAHETRLRVLRRGVSTVVPSADGAIVAGRRGVERLAFARVGRHTRVLRTDLHPWVAASQDRYPLISDGHNGAWAQAVDSNRDLVVVRVTRRGLVTAPTGLTPVAREFAVGPGGNLWTQATADGLLVLVKVTPRGRVETFPTGLAPTAVVLAPVADRRGHLWFRAADPGTGELVLVRIGADR